LEKWQHDYRLGLLLIQPPEEIAAAIASLRARYDPKSHAICPTHISVSDPLQCEMTPELEDEIRQILKSIAPFELYFDRPVASLERPGVAYPITPQEPIDELKEALHPSAVFSGRVYQRRGIPSHMTIAEFISVEESSRIFCAEMLDSAPSGSFLCDRLEFVVPDESFRFQRCGTFLLKV
jgi:2'-5' RNA ligase